MLGFNRANLSKSTKCDKKIKLNTLAYIIDGSEEALEFIAFISFLAKHLDRARKNESS